MSLISQLRLPRAVSLVSVLVIALFVLACQTEDAEPPDPSPTVASTTPETPVPTAAPGEPQILYVNLTSEPSSIDPQRATDQVSLTLVRALHSGLLRLSPEDELMADLAEEVPTVENGGISADGLTYTFRLRDGLQWSDGMPLEAQAFVDAAKRLFEPGAANQYADFYRDLAADGPDGDANVAYQAAVADGASGEELNELAQAVVDGLQVEAPDAQTVVYHLNRPSPVFPLLASLWPLYPVRQDLVDEHGAAWTEAGTHVGNGPFALAAWDHGEGVRLERNENWHGGAVALDAIEFDMIDDAAVAFLAYENDEIDIIVLGPAELVQVRRDEALRAQFRGYAELTAIGVYPNLEDPILSDARVRQALAGSLDRVEFASAVLEGNALPAYAWLPPGMPGHDAEAGRQYEAAVDESRALLTDADADGVVLTILTPEASTAVLTAQWLKEQWETNLGITVELDIRETAAYVTARGAGEFQLTVGGWGADYPDPQNWLTVFASGSPLNAGNFSNTDFDGLIAAAAEELDYEERIDIYLGAQRILIDEAGVIPLYYRVRGGLVKPWVQGLATSAREGAVPGDLFFDRVSIAERP